MPLGDYDEDHPAEAHLIIEVAESSLKVDRGKKRRLYAACGVPEYWIVNLVDHCVEVHTSIVAGDYTTVESFVRGQAIRLAAFADVEVQVSNILK